MTPEFKQTFFLSAGETNAEQEISLPLLTSKIIDIATAHANSLGIGNPAMGARGWGSIRRLPGSNPGTGISQCAIS